MECPSLFADRNTWRNYLLSLNEQQTDDLIIQVTKLSELLKDLILEESSN